jgi:peptidoglycan/xylan/chitin deacetylase (PgdA/CDA1 family)
MDTRKLILLYHRIASPRHDPFALAVPENWFHDHLDILKSQCRLVALSELLRTDIAESVALATITFDDGYLDNLTTASPVLRQAGIPATFFICTGYLGDARGFWWDRVATAIATADPLLSEPQAATEPGLRRLLATAARSTLDARRKATLEIASHLQRMRPTDRDRVVADLETVLVARASSEVEPCPVLDEAGVRELAAQGIAHLGAHTHSHSMLSVLTRDEQLAEIERSVTGIEDITGIRPQVLAYPYGSEQDYNEDSCLAARDAGLQAAFVNHAARFDPKGQPYRVPRYYVPPLPADQFRTWLCRILRAA